MAQIQINVEAIPAVIVLDNVQSAIAFEKISPKAFVDHQIEDDGAKIPVATWTNDYVDIDGVRYPYRTWHKIGSEESSFKKYFKQTISKGVNPFGHIFTV